MIKKKTFILSLLVMMVVTAFSEIKVHAEDLYVEYKGQAEKVFQVSDDFFVNNSALLPGDTAEDTIALTNSFSQSVKFYFRTKPLSSQEYELEEDYELLDRIELKISLVKNGSETEIYSGPLGSRDFTEFRELGTMNSQEKAELRFQLTVPAELTNRFDMTRTKVKWVFGITDSEGNEIRTGDMTDIMKYIFTGDLALIVSVYFYQKNTDEENSSRKESDNK